MHKLYLFVGALLLSFAATAQLDNITGVTLTFTPTTGTAVTATATDAGSGLTVDGGVTLMESTDYVLTVAVVSGSDDITSQITSGGDNYQLFFAPTEDILSGEVTATDNSDNGLPLGLTNDLTTACTEEGDATGTLRAVLSDVTGTKSDTATIDGATALFDFTLMVTVEDDVDAPACENEEEIITDVVLTFTPTDGGAAITASAQDPDGEGPLDLEIVDDIELVESTEYTLTMTLSNSVEGEDITAEIMEEEDDHMFFFAFTDEIFTSPAGDGNADNRADPINYNDTDDNGLPVGLSTNWETECGEEAATGTFRVILKHQPESKTATSTIDDGGTDVDLTWNINVSEDPDAPPCENEEEIITDVVLTWSPVDGGDTLRVRAQDPDGEGPLDLEILDDIALVENTTYTLTLELSNSVEGEDITTEISEEDDEHMFFFAFTDSIFTSPPGDGNVDNRADSIAYNDFDENGLPVGLSTTWTTPANMGFGGTFRIVLKHQPDIKSATSTVDDGGTDLDLSFGLNTTTSIRGPQGALNDRLSVVPNPTRSYLNWSLSDLQTNDKLEIRIISITGQVLQTYRSPSSRIDVSQLPAGSYLFHVQTERASGIKRFIKVE